MSRISRRVAVKLAAGLSVGAGLVTVGESRGEEVQKPAPKDLELSSAVEHLPSYMFAEQVTFKTSVTEPHSFRLNFTSAVEPGGNGHGVEVRPGTVRVFRDAGDQDKSTKSSGLHWKCGAATGTVQFKEPGGLILAVRDLDGTVRCYRLVFDLRC